MPWAIQSNSLMPWCFSMRALSVFKVMQRTCVDNTGDPSMICLRRFLPNEELSKTITQGPGGESLANGLSLRHHFGHYALSEPEDRNRRLANPSGHSSCHFSPGFPTTVGLMAELSDFEDRVA